MENNLRIGKEEISGCWCAAASFSLTKATTPYLLVIADRKDGAQDMILYRKSKDQAELVAQRKLQYHVKYDIARKMTDALMVQMKVRRKFPERNVVSIVRSFETLFQKTEKTHSLFRQMKALMQQTGISYGAVLNLSKALVEQCEMNFTDYEHFFSAAGLQNCMHHLFISMFMEWNSLMRLIREFLNEQELWKQDKGADVQMVLYGSMRLLVALAEPKVSRTQRIQMGPKSNYVLYSKTVEMLRGETKENKWDLYIGVSDYPYERAVLDANAKLEAAKAKQHECRMETVSVLADRVLCVPSGSCVYAGSKNGVRLPVSVPEQPADTEGIMLPPYSEVFAAYVASGKIRPVCQRWERLEDEWQFTLEYEYKGTKYRIRPRIYRNDAIVRMEQLPSVVLYTNGESDNICVSTEGSVYSTEVYRGIRQNGVVQLESDADTCYIRFSDGEGYLSQLEISMVGGDSDA